MSTPVPRWQPDASWQTLHQRASALAAAREFFAMRGILEVETPLLVRHPVSDPQLANVRCQLDVYPGAPRFLHTSPEYHMKRLLAAGAPDIYQICKVFRDGELGPRHLPEFTLIEWYRHQPGYDAFITECCDFIAAVGTAAGRTPPVPQRRSYGSLFRETAGLDPLTADLAGIRARTRKLLAGTLTDSLARNLGEDRTGWLDLLMVSVVEPALRSQGLVVVDQYPAQQAALARLDAQDPRVAERFEIYLDGIELANGYHELADAAEQRRRFETDRARRREQGLPDTTPDGNLLAALDHGLPDCCGVALGFDRLLMAGQGTANIASVVSFASRQDG